MPLQCPKSPNCVSSLAKDDTHAILLIEFKGEAEAALLHLSEVIKEMGGTVVERDRSSLHATFSSRFFGFVDDVHCIIHKEHLIDIRSASRTGYYDFGANRRRVEKIRKNFLSDKSSPSPLNHKYGGH